MTCGQKGKAKKNRPRGLFYCHISVSSVVKQCLGFFGVIWENRQFKNSGSEGLQVVIYQEIM